MAADNPSPKASVRNVHTVATPQPNPDRNRRQEVNGSIGRYWNSQNKWATSQASPQRKQLPSTTKGFASDREDMSTIVPKSSPIFRVVRVFRGQTLLRLLHLSLIACPLQLVAYRQGRAGAANSRQAFQQRRADIFEALSQQSIVSCALHRQCFGFL